MRPRKIVHTIYKRLAKIWGAYNVWIFNNEPQRRGFKKMRREASLWIDPPTISIIVPIDHPSLFGLIPCVDSVLDQIYERWELVLVEDGLLENDIREVIRKISDREPRIKSIVYDVNLDRTGSLNAGLFAASGEYVGLLDSRDRLAPFALYEIAKYLHQNTKIDGLYSDEDHIETSRNKRSNPHFKPCWSPDTLLSYNYIQNFFVFRKKLAEALGGFRNPYGCAQIYDFILRLGERTGNIAHLPKVLYHRRTPQSAPRTYDMPDAYELNKTVIQDFLKMKEIKADVLDGKLPYLYRVRYAVKPAQKVSILIPTKDKAALLKTCLDSVLNKTDFKNFEVIIIDNNSMEEETFSFFKSIQSRQVRILRYEKPFNFSAINNFAVASSDSEQIVFLNNDTEVISSEWLSAMLEFSQREDVGAVGAKLYYGNGLIQHGGVIIGLGGIAGHSHKFYPRNDPGYMGRLSMIQNVSAVTGACMMVRRNVFNEVGGFDERLSHAYNDVDLCLKIRERGYLIIFTPYAELYHLESISRGYEDTPEKKARFARAIRMMQGKWGETLERGDPYYSPNLTQNREDFSIRVTP